VTPHSCVIHLCPFLLGSCIRARSLLVWRKSGTTGTSFREPRIHHIRARRGAPSTTSGVRPMGMAQLARRGPRIAAAGSTPAHSTSLTQT
jgi:hypothetical protein